MKITKNNRVSIINYKKNKFIYCEQIKLSL